MRRAVLAFAMALSTVSACGGVVTPSTPPPTCQEAEAWLARGLLDRARDEWVRVQAVTPPLNCPVDVGAEVAARRSRAAAAYERGLVLKDSDPTGAAREFSAALVDDPSDEDARAALLALADVPSDDDPFAAVIRLDDLGEREEARKKLIEAAADAPVPPNVAERFEVRTPFGTVPRITGVAADFLTPTVLLSAFLLVLLVVGRWGSRRFRAPLVDVGTFVAAGTDTKLEGGMPSLIENGLSVFERDNGRSPIQTVVGPASLEAFPADIKSAAPQAAIVSAIVAYIVPRRLITLTGSIISSLTEGAGIALTLNRDGAITGSTTVWQKDFDPGYKPGDAVSADVVRRLAIPASVWLRYQIEPGPFAPLGARRWKSYAMNAEGTRLLRRDDDEGARRLFVDALEEDDENLGAAYNLALLDSDAARTLAGQNAVIERLEAVRAAANDTKAWRRQADALWYRATYLLAAAHSYAHELATDAKLKETICDEGLKLLADLRAEVERPVGQGEAPGTTELVAKLKGIEPLIRSAFTGWKNGYDDALAILASQHVHATDRDGQYALACTHSILSTIAPKKAIVSELESSILALRRALRMGEGADALKDPSLESVRTSALRLSNGNRAKDEFKAVIQSVTPAPPSPRDPLAKIRAALGLD